MLRAWGGNASGSGIANIDNIGDVHPDTYWWQHTVATCAASVQRHLAARAGPTAAGAAPASASGEWPLCRMPLAVDLQRQHPYPRLGAGDLWAEDPGCYLSDEEIGLPTPERIPSIAI